MPLRPLLALALAGSFSQGPHTQAGEKAQTTPNSYTNPVTGGAIHSIVKTKRLEDLGNQGLPFYGTLRYDVQCIDTASGAKISDFRMNFARGFGPVRIRGRFLDRTFDLKLRSMSWPVSSPQ